MNRGATSSVEATGGNNDARELARRHGRQRLAIALLFMVLVGMVMAQPELEHLRFDRGETVTGTVYSIGINAFTAAQLSYFLASIEDFLALSDTLPEGERVTLRQEGEQGYIALTAYDTDATPYYVITLAAEEPTGIASLQGLQAAWVLLADQLPQFAASSEAAVGTP